MVAPFYERLKKYYRDVGGVLRGEAAVASIFPNTTDIGMAREQVYAEFLRAHLPPNCNVLIGGFLFSLDGNESNQIDLIVTFASCPQFNFTGALPAQGKSFACIEGTLAVVSLKSNLTSAELEHALQNLASIPPQEPLGKRVNPLLLPLQDYEEWPFKIIYACDGVSIPTAISTIQQFYESNSSIPWGRRPNLIHVAGKYNLIRTLKEEKTRGGAEIPPNTFHPVNDPTDVFALAYAVEKIQQNALVAQHILFTYEKILDSIRF